METTVILKAIGVLFCCFLVFAAGCLVAHIGMLWGKRELKREDEYYRYYVDIQGYIRDLPVTLNNYYRILSKIIELKNLKYKNPEKTKVLRDNFYWKYRTIAKQRANEPCKQYSKIKL